MSVAARRRLPTPTEHPQTIRAVAWCLACLYAVLAPLHLVMLAAPARPLMAALATVSCGVLVLLALQTRGRLEMGPGPVTAVALVPIVNTLAHLALTGDLQQTTLLMITAVAIGAGLARPRVIGGLLLTVVTGWVAVVVGRSLLGGPELGRAAPEAVELGVAVVAAGLLATTRARRERRLALSEQRFRGLFDDSPVGIGLADEHGRFVTVNDALCTLLGRPADDLVGSTSAPFTHPGDLAERARARQLIAAAPDGIARVDKRYVRPDGEIRHAWLTLTTVDGPQGQPWTLAHMQDVTERFLVDQALRDSEASLAAVAAVSRRIRRGEDPRQGIVEAACELAGAQSACLVEADPEDPTSLIFTHGAGACRLVGQVLPRSSTSGTAHAWRTGTTLFLADPDQSPLVDPDLLQRTGARSLLWQPVLVHDQVVALLSISWGERAPDLADRSVRAIALLADEAAVALEHDELVRRLRDRARTDELTGLPNRRAWNHQLDRLLAGAGAGASVTVALADLDRFKNYNDEHGHQAGDELLRTFASRAADTLRADDLLARWGGEEFAVALVGEPLPVRAVLDRLLDAAPSGQTLSIGSAVWDGEESAQALLGRADAALYAAKDAGRARLVEAGG